MEAMKILNPDFLMASSNFYINQWLSDLARNPEGESVNVHLVAYMLDKHVKHINDAEIELIKKKTFDRESFRPWVEIMIAQKNNNPICNQTILSIKIISKIYSEYKCIPKRIKRSIFSEFAEEQRIHVGAAMGLFARFAAMFTPDGFGVYE